MTQTFDLKKMGLAPMTNLEMQEVDGGEWPSWVKSLGLAGLASEVIENWDEIKQEFKDGWNALK